MGGDGLGGGGGGDGGYGLGGGGLGGEGLGGGGRGGGDGNVELDAAGGPETYAPGTKFVIVVLPPFEMMLLMLVVILPEFPVLGTPVFVFVEIVMTGVVVFPLNPAVGA